MADAVILPQVQPVRPAVQFFKLIPGVLLLAGVGYAGKLLEQNVGKYAKSHHWTFPNIEYVLWAILIGLAISNTVGIPQIFRAGVATYEFWLKAGIVLLGSRFLLGDVLKLGGASLALVVIEIAVAIGFMTLLGRAFGLKPKLTSLLAVGSAVCGVSAIIATKGAIEADDEDSSFAIAAILALGALSLFTFPLIGHALHLTDHAYGVWSGLAVDNTAEAAAAGALYSDSAGKLAVLTKTTRNALIGFVVLAYALYWASRGQAQAIGNKASFLWQKFPKFVLGFLLISLLATFAVFNKDQIGALANLSRWAFLLTFAGVGLRTNFRELAKQGLKPFAVGAIGEVVIAVFTLGLVYGAQRIFHW
ncbi:MAG TPA: putative sulfate exporter family transporter [Candidatus Acidoferrum sp.]|nr:putative sulfate exporter family transporter [Candidatus Acidoferrum sp.]